MNGRVRTALRVGIAVAVFVVLWHLTSVVAPDKVPPPVGVMTLAVDVAVTEGPRGHTGLYHLGVTLGRVFATVLIALVVSVALGVAMGVNRTVEKPFADVLPVWMTIPDVVLVLFAMILLGFTDVAIISSVAFLAIPFGVVNTWQGTKDVNPDIVEMADAFDADGRLRWRHIYIPHLAPYLLASGRYLLGMIWKVVLMAEAFGIATGVGSMVRFWYRQADIPHLLAYFTLFAVTVFVIEYGILGYLERRAFAWRPD